MQSQKNIHRNNTDSVETIGHSKTSTPRVQTKNKTKLRSIETIAPLLEKLEALSKSPESRELQKKTYRELKESLIRGEKGGTIKLPTGTGKTRVFANMLAAFGKNGLTLVPRVDLYDSTVLDFKDVGFKDSEIKLLGDEGGANTTDKMLSLLTDPNINWSSGRIQCIMTYQALTALAKKSPEMSDFMCTRFEIIIEDEAHRGLGDKTKKATGALTTDDEEDEGMESGDEIMEDEDEIAEELVELEAETILGITEDKNSGARYHYKFTATPDLLGKSVTEDGEYISYATVEDAVRTGAILLPRYVDMGAAYIKTAELSSWKPADIDRLAEGDNFIDENGRSIREKVIEAYIEKKREHGHLPAVAFASTIEHARQIVELMNEQGIRATRVTSGAGDMSSADAVKLMDRGELDVIVTVTKVSEGFNYPPLACAMWFTPSLSPAKILQGNGRIMRDTDQKKPETILDADGKLVPSPNTYIIAPSVWFGGAIGTKGGGEGRGKGEPTGPNPGKGKLPRIGNFYELLIGQNELNINSLSEEMRGIIDVNTSIMCEVGERVQIDGVLYVGVTGTQEIMGVKGETILDNAKRQDIKIYQSKQKNNGHPVRLVPESFIKGLIISHECEVGEKIMIDEVMYVGVAQKKEVMGIKGITILENAKRQEIQIIQAKQKNGYSVQLIPESFIQGLMVSYKCEVGEKVEIDKVVYVGVTGTKEIMGIQGKKILKNATKQEIQMIQGKQKNGLSVQLVPESFIKGLKNTCEVGEKIMIDGVKYLGVIQSQEIMKLQGQKILRNAKKQGINIIQGKQKSGHSIKLVPEIFILELKKQQK